MAFWPNRRQPQINPFMALDTSVGAFFMHDPAGIRCSIPPATAWR